MSPLRPRRELTRSTISSLRLLGLLCGTAIISLPFVLQAAPPAWWASRGVTPPNSAPNDFAAVNQGQLKFMAEQAAAEMDANLPGGAGDAVHALVAGWATPTAQSNDFAPVNLGMLKTVAAPFYAQLILAGYTDLYPWTASTAPVDDFATANLGQVKNLFSFDLSLDGANGELPVWWELKYFGHTGVDPNALAPRGDGLTYLQAFQQGVNPNDYYNGQLPVVSVASGDAQTGSPGGFVPAPLVVSVTDANGNPLQNAPVTLLASAGGGQLQASNSVPAVTPLPLRTDANGQARAFFRLPNAPNAVCQVRATAASGSQGAQAVFTEVSDGGGGTFGSPFAPTNLVSQGNPDGSLDMTWTNNTDGQTPVEVEFQQADGTWRLVATLPPGTTSYHYSPGQ